MLYTNFQIEAMLPAYGNLKTIEAKDVSNVSNAFLTISSHPSIFTRRAFDILCSSDHSTSTGSAAALSAGFAPGVIVKNVL